MRAIALITLFQQPEDELPNLIVVDEPELGLHPDAMTIIAGLMRAASSHTQVLLATQSPTFLDHFSPDEVIVAEAKEHASHYRRVTPEELRSGCSSTALANCGRRTCSAEGQCRERALRVLRRPHRAGVLQAGARAAPYCSSIVASTRSRSPILDTTASSSRGGIGKYETLRFDIQSTIKSRRKQQGVYFTTMIDLYGLPGDFPGKANHVRNPQNPRP